MLLKLCTVTPAANTLRADSRVMTMARTDRRRVMVVCSAWWWDYGVGVRGTHMLAPRFPDAIENLSKCCQSRAGLGWRGGMGPTRYGCGSCLRDQSLPIGCVSATAPCFL